jgi:FdhD protein
MILTSGCGGGISFRNPAETQTPLESSMAITPQVILDRMADLNQAATLYRRVRGVPTSVLASQQAVLFCAEDVGRHNTIDKLAGKAMRARLDMHDRLLVTSGRISSEMLSKARQMGVPIVASRTAPTSISVGLAQAWNICVVGYVRHGSMRVYTHAERLGLDDQVD